MKNTDYSLQTNKKICPHCSIIHDDKFSICQKCNQPLEDYAPKSVSNDTNLSIFEAFYVVMPFVGFLVGSCLFPRNRKKAISLIVFSSVMMLIELIVILAVMACKLGPRFTWPRGCCF